MELNENVTKLFAALYNSLTKADVQAIDFLLRMNFPHHWPRLEPLTRKVVLEKMKELGLFVVDQQLGQCRLSSVILLLNEIGRRDLSAEVEKFGQYSVVSKLTEYNHFLVYNTCTPAESNNK